MLRASCKASSSSFSSSSSSSPYHHQDDDPDLGRREGRPRKNNAGKRRRRRKEHQMEGLYDCSAVCVCACVACTTWQMALWAAVGRRRRRRRHLLLSARWCHTAGKMEEGGGNSIRPLSLSSLSLSRHTDGNVDCIPTEGRKETFFFLPPLSTEQMKSDCWRRKKKRFPSFLP